MTNHCFYGLTGKVITPDDLEYEEARQEFNRAIQRFPLAIVYCYDKYDVANAVQWAIAFCVPIRIRGGGHHYEGYSTGDGVLVIDISPMTGLSMRDDLLRVEGGVTNTRLYDYVSTQGYPFPGGTCPTVGVAGFALGGGWGLSCRLFGLGCDSLTELELVDYTGRILVANDRCNSDLFWACRGAGGGNFGIVVSMTFRLPPKTDKVTLIEFSYADTDRDKQARYLDAWQRWLAGADERITLLSRIYHAAGEDFGVSCRGIFYGLPQEAEAMLRPLTGLGGCSLNLGYVTFYEAIKTIEATYPSSEMFRSAGRFVVRPLDAGEILHTVDLIRDVPEGSVFSALSLYALGGRVTETGPFDTAFYFRDAQYILAVQSMWTDARYTEINRLWVGRQFRYIEGITPGSFVNFPYSGLTDYLTAYFGQNAERLRLVKTAYDPFNVFNFPQSIPPADCEE